LNHFILYIIMEKLIERIQSLEDRVKSLKEESEELKQVIKELYKCEYCERIRSLYNCIGCARKICRKCCIKTETKSYRGDPICEITCKICEGE
jgi:hypothetical protein